MEGVVSLAVQDIRTGAVSMADMIFSFSACAERSMQHGRSFGLFRQSRVFHVLCQICHNIFLFRGLI